MRPPRALLASLLALSLLASCTSQSDTPDSAPANSADSASDRTTDSTPDAQPTEYVALGDSYAAMGSASAPTSGPGPCVRSADNYPAEIMKEPSINGEDRSCSGAQTEHVLEPWDIGGQNIPAQVDALGENTQLVTLSIGGNDISFSSMVDCFSGVLLGGNDGLCRDRIGEQTQESMDALPDKLDRVYAEIGSRAPDATVVATGYYPLVSRTGECSSLAAIAPADREWLTGVIAQLNSTVEAAATRAGADYVLPEDSEEHTACAEASKRWVNTFGTDTDSYPMHPTALGQVAMADAILTR